MPTTIKGCFECNIKVTEACESAYREQCPPCAKLAVENGNSLQQLKAEIAAQCKQFDDMAIEDIEASDCIAFISRMRQLSAV